MYGIVSVAGAVLEVDGEGSLALFGGLNAIVDVNLILKRYLQTTKRAL